MSRQSDDGLSELVRARLAREKEERPKRVKRVGAKLTARWEKRIRKKPMRRKLTPKIENVVKRLRPFIAYDLETTSIKPGTPRPLYLTACGAEFWHSGRVRSIEQLAIVLINRFLTRENAGARFVAWNGNKFDVYLVSLALLKSPDYLLIPYLTRTKNLRGLRVVLRQYDEKGVEITASLKPKERVEWEFLDGLSMTIGSQPVTLKKFLSVFAPDYQKLEAPDFEHEEFDPENPAHVAYAERDSEGLYHGLMKAQNVVLEHFSIALQPTIGNMGIKIFQRHMPEGVTCWAPPYSAQQAIRDYAMRGGFCFCVKRYRGPVWKYDINQAYAAAMRDARLPAGRCIHSIKGNPYADVYIARVIASNPRNRVPFYVREIADGKPCFALTEIGETWLTSIEIEQLRAEGWRVEVREMFFWESSFSMREYVDTLERLRMPAPKTALGEMLKAIGNNSYGKTVEKLEGVELVLSSEQPPGFAAYQAENDELQYVWFRFRAPMLREYHQPQIGAFITAHVRMVLRRGILQAPDAWLYADTDCLIFSRPVALPIDPGRYGWWKIEEQGTEYVLANKKVYASIDGATKHAKGMNVKRLVTEDFVRWYEGSPPEQTQVHRQNYIKVLTGFEMFEERVKVGERK